MERAWWFHHRGEPVVGIMRDETADDDGIERVVRVVHLAGCGDPLTLDEVVPIAPLRPPRTAPYVGAPRARAGEAEQHVLRFFLDQPDDAWCITQQIWNPENFAKFQRGEARCEPVPHRIRAALSRLVERGVLEARAELVARSGYTNLYAYRKGPRFGEVA